MKNPDQPDLAQEVQELRNEVHGLRKRVRSLRKTMILCTAGLGAVIVFTFIPGNQIFAAVGTLAVIFVVLFFFDSTIRRIVFGWQALDDLERKTVDRWTTLSGHWHQKHLEAEAKRSSPTK